MSDWQVLTEDRAHLGEGLHWDGGRGVLWWVDIQQRRVWRWSLEPGADPIACNMPQRVGWVLPTRGRDGDARDTMLLGLQAGVVRWDPDRAALDEGSWIRPWPEGTALRLNDAKADRWGRVWAGSLNPDDEQRPDGSFMHIDPERGTVQVLDPGYCVANGPALHPDGRLLLHTDSVQRTIFAFDIVDGEAGVVANKRVWMRLQGAEGYPDGMNFDADGCLWLAHWGGACVSRYAPDGRLLRRVPLPTDHITNVCFGGPGLDRLFVTSASAGLTPSQRAAQPLAGALFEIDAAGVRGLPGWPACI